MNVKKLLHEKWPYLYFLVLTIVVFSGFIFSNKMLFGSDTVEAGIFFRSFYADFVKTYHRIPMWNPYIFCGLPFVDAMHGDTFYPLAALQFIMPIYKALGYKLAVTVFLAGCFMYLYLRKMKLSKWAGVFGGTAYMLSGFLVSLVYAGHDGRMYVTSLLPLLLYTMEIGFERGRILWWWPFSVAFGLLILANHPQFAYFSMWCVGAYFTLKMVFVLRQNKTARNLMIPISGFILAMAFGLALALVQIWPTQDYVSKYSPRAEGGRGYEYASSWALHAEEAFSQVIPGFAGYSTLGNHPPLSTEQTYWGKNYFKINSEYAGLVVVILGLMGMFIYRDRYSWFFLGTAIFALLYGLGNSGIIFKPIYYVVPFVSKFRAPSTIMFLFCFAMAFLAARAVDHLERIKKIVNADKIFRWMLIFAGLYLLGALLVAAAGKGIMGIYTAIFYSGIEPGQLSNLYANLPNITIGLFIGALFCVVCAITMRAAVRHKMTFSIMAIVFIALALLDSWIFNDMKFIRTVDPSPYFQKPQIASILQGQPGPFRVFEAPQTLASQNILAQFGIDQVTGYHGNQLRWFDAFIGGNALSNLNRPAVMALTNTEYLIARQQLNHPMFNLVNTTRDGINIYKNLSAVPRGRILYNYQVIANQDSALAMALRPDFDYANNLILDRQPQGTITPQQPSTLDHVQFLDSPPDRIKLTASLSARGLLALQDNWYPFWNAYESGKKIPIYRADYTFMALELEPGRHEIEFRLENPKYILGKNASILSWLLLIAGLGAGAVLNVISARKAQNDLDAK